LMIPLISFWPLYISPDDTSDIFLAIII
jgi:hypothetical protein